MRGRRPLGALIGLAMIGLGVLILLAMVLPAGFWWFVLGLGLIGGGWGCCRRRW